MIHSDGIAFRPISWSVVLRHVPAGLSAARLLALPWLLHQARQGHYRRVSRVQVALIGIDVIDGMLARRIGDPEALRRQRQLDGLADLGLFAVAPMCARLVRPEVAREQCRGIAVLVGAQVLSALACWCRFRRLPRYHTSLFRWSAGGVGLLLAARLEHGGFALGLRLAIWLHTLAHLEALIVSCLLRSYREPVCSAWKVHRVPAP